MRYARLLAFIAATAPLATVSAASAAADAGPQPRLSLGFATTNSDSTINGDVEARLDCPGVIFDVRFAATMKHAADAEQALARATPILSQELKPYRDFCRSPAPRPVDRGFERGLAETRTSLHVTGASQDEEGVSGALAVTVSCPALTAEVRAAFSGAKTKQEVVDQTKDVIEREAKALQPYCAG